MKHFQSLVDLLQFRASEQPDKVAYVFLQNGENESGSLTYGSLDKKAKAIAFHLQSKLPQSERVLIAYPSSLEFITAFFGCIYAGMIAVPAYPPRRNRNISRLLEIISDSTVSSILASETVIDGIKESCPASIENVLSKSCSVEDIEYELAGEWRQQKVNTDTTAFLQYTSGSTGKPKGVIVSHGNILSNEQAIKEAFGHSEKTVVLGWLPLHHDMGLIGNVLQPIYLGCECILMPPVTFLQKPYRWLKAIERYRATTSGGPNFAYDMCVNSINQEDRESLDLSSWEVAFCGAEPVRVETLNRFITAFEHSGFRNNSFYPCYGMAETTLFATGGDREKFPLIQKIDKEALRNNQAFANASTEDLKSCLELVSCGRTWLDQEVCIVDPETRIQLDQGKIGEIWVSGSSVAQGYWNKPEETQSIFNAQISGNEWQPFLRTGDLGFLLEGELFITGRLKDIIIVRGKNHYPQDIELTVSKSHAALEFLPGVAFSVEVNGAEQLVIVQEIARSYLRNINLDEVVNAIRRAVSQEHLLSVYAISLVKPYSIPKTTSGKVQRKACCSAFLNETLEVVSNWVADFNQLKIEQLQIEVDALLEQIHRSMKTNLSSEQREKLVQKWLIVNLAKHLKIHPSKVDIEQPFSEYGLDSSLAINLTGELEEWLGCELEPTLFWDFPSIEHLSKFIGHQI